ncbi:hypothetical protein C8Q72DRAFT_790963 [Fomitopsis betulina]|nr:hypothetical protein C8Q72DRAFT_790963 [Fomitopsis betulina]
MYALPVTAHGADTLVARNVGQPPSTVAPQSISPAVDAIDHQLLRGRDGQKGHTHVHKAHRLEHAIVRSDSPPAVHGLFTGTVRRRLVRNPTDRLSGGHEASQLETYGWDGMATAMPRHRRSKQSRCAQPNPQTSLGTHLACRAVAYAEEGRRSKNAKQRGAPGIGIKLAFVKIDIKLGLRRRGVQAILYCPNRAFVLVANTSAATATGRQEHRPVARELVGFSAAREVLVSMGPERRRSASKPSVR